MTMQLDIGGDRILASPSKDDLRDAIAGLDASTGNAFLVLGEEEMTYIQCSGDRDAGFVVEFQEGSLERHYRARNSVDPELLLEMLFSYAEGDDLWEEAVDWMKVDVLGEEGD